MKNPLLLAVFCLGLFLLVAFYFVSKTLYKIRHKAGYHFYQMFPYEFNYPSVFKENIWGNFLFILACFAVVAFYILYPYESMYRTIAIAVSIVLAMVFLCLLMMPMHYLKTHLVLSIISMTLSLAIVLIGLIFGYTNYKFYNDNNIVRILSIASMVYSGLLSLAMLVLILNPKLTFKIYLDKDTDSSGNEVLKRPRVIFLALNEWVSIFVYFLSPLSILLPLLVH